MLGAKLFLHLFEGKAKVIPHYSYILTPICAIINDHCECLTIVYSLNKSKCLLTAKGGNDEYDISMGFTIDGSGVLSGSSHTTPDIVIPQRVKKILKDCFLKDTNVTEKISFENNSLLASIDVNGFDGLNALQKIDFRNCLSLIEIPDLCFMQCTSLECVILPDDGCLTRIGSGAFAHCESLSFINFPPTLERLGEWKNTGIFFNCIALKSIQISPSIKLNNIPGHTFLDSGITTFVLPKSVNHIDSAPFLGCKNVQYFAIEEGNIKYSLEDMFIYSDSKQVIAGVDPRISGNITVPPHVTSIINQAFRGSSITGITIPNSVSIIDNYAFASCDSLIYVHLPSSVTSITAAAFNFCPSLSYFRIDGAPNIDSASFHNSKIDCGFVLSSAARQKFVDAGYNIGTNPCPLRTICPRTTKLYNPITCKKLHYSRPSSTLIFFFGLIIGK